MADKDDRYQIELEVNGKAVETGPFVERIACATILGMISALKDVEVPKQVTIKISAKD